MKKEKDFDFKFCYLCNNLIKKGKRYKCYFCNRFVCEKHILMDNLICEKCLNELFKKSSLNFKEKLKTNKN